MPDADKAASGGGHGMGAEPSDKVAGCDAKMLRALFPSVFGAEPKGVRPVETAAFRKRLAASPRLREELRRLCAEHGPADLDALADALRESIGAVGRRRRGPRKEHVPLEARLLANQRGRELMELVRAAPRGRQAYTVKRFVGRSVREIAKLLPRGHSEAGRWDRARKLLDDAEQRAGQIHYMRSTINLPSKTTAWTTGPVWSWSGTVPVGGSGGGGKKG